MVGEGLFNRPQPQDDTENSGRHAMAPERPTIEEQVLQLTSFKGHDHDPVGSVQRGDHTFRAGAEGNVVPGSGSDAKAATEAEILVEFCLSVGRHGL